MRSLYMEALETMGYQTAGAGDGAAGVEATLRLLPAAVLMDVGLPVLNGIEAARLIKEDPRTSQCLVIVMTGGGMKSFEDARAAGCDAFLGKPFAIAALGEALRTLSSPQSMMHARADLVKICTCGREHSLKQWLALPAGGRMHVPQRGVVLELRTCQCGSTMTVELDDVGIARTMNALKEEGATAARKRLLVVDRDPHIRRLLQQFLGQQHVIEFADDGYSALDRVRLSPPAAVVTEIMIPRLDGLALCRAIKADPVIQHVPILVISTLLANERALHSGANAFLTKPLEREGLVASVALIIDAQERRASPPETSTTS